MNPKTNQPQSSNNNLSAPGGVQPGSVQPQSNSVPSANGGSTGMVESQNDFEQKMQESLSQIPQNDLSQPENNGADLQSPGINQVNSPSMQNQNTNNSQPSVEPGFTQADISSGKPLSSEQNNLSTGGSGQTPDGGAGFGGNSSNDIQDALSPKTENSINNINNEGAFSPQPQPSSVSFDSKPQKTNIIGLILQVVNIVLVVVVLILVIIK